MLLRCLLPLALLPLAAVASAACTLTDPTLTLQSYRVDAQKERIAMYWQDRHGKAWGSLRSLLAGIDGDGRAKIVPLPAYKPSPAIRYAVQSGPMLIENGVINWRLKPSASSRKLRNGVGIDKQGRVVFMLSDRETNFYDFACYAQSKLGVRQMLYLDGTLSKMYRKGGSVPWQYHPFVTMITVERK
ncbi:TPA: phosphodiester glycosidase family protein [Klebsiella variicola]|uniref:phosphodiester glycosidase family protein n=1 Tax=Klebsiella variicola TaxID=244366 RepID=UPI000E2C6F4E|nr:phosphodiester glycosidase family protein [Klebsiella variicola]MBZ6720677.1 hypothetical protein [Klebsiella variicola]SXF00149.1 lipoprotein [Klebsiella variicola]HCA5406907.1 phosphodiester glycosidase family protein [Klebsiella variicola]HDK6252761.1 phosphodiester glycosidase family protein [Klebsiella variicola]HDU5939585.1 phosphodiester glycosidase family protein [Klebsiella variicola]